MYDYQFSIDHQRFHRERLLAAAETYRLVKLARAARARTRQRLARRATSPPHGTRRLTVEEVRHAAH